MEAATHQKSSQIEKRRSDAKKIRAQNPAHIPAVCLRSTQPGDESTKTKLLVPGCMSVTDFVEVVRARCPWAQNGQLLAGGVPLDKDLSMSEVDCRYKAKDGFLYIVPAGEAAAVQEVDSSAPTVPKKKEDEETAAVQEVDSSASKPCEGQEPEPAVKSRSNSATSTTVFHLPDQDPDDDADKTTNEQASDGAKRAKEAKKVLARYPDRVPILCIPDPSPSGEARKVLKQGMPARKKMLAPRTMLCGDFKATIKKELGQGIKRGQILLLVGHVALEDSKTMVDLYEEHKASDGILHVTVELQDLAGSDWLGEAACSRDSAAKEARDIDILNAYIKIDLEEALAASELRASAEAKRAEDEEKRSEALVAKVAALEKALEIAHEMAEEAVAGVEKALELANKRAEEAAQNEAEEWRTQRRMAEEAAQEVLILSKAMEAAAEQAAVESQRRATAEAMCEEQAKQLAELSEALETSKAKERQEAERMEMALSDLALREAQKAAACAAESGDGGFLNVECSECSECSADSADLEGSECSEGFVHLE
mmetsp:Transcript_64283/g.103948  ORF Transcript_64283/g.103948 Transcript_64283/m.103948 type:complete len:541 (-) Transcript_64283:39-1661(-)